MAESFLWRGPRLLVPVTLEALVVTTRAQNLGWQYRANHYATMRFFGGIEPTPFSNTTTAPATGIHLHWALPDAVTHGRENAEGVIEYPPVPNRWLVCRSHAASDGSGRRILKAWVVVSDRLDPTNSRGSLFPDPFSTTFGATRLGDWVVQEEWHGEADAETSDFVLNAVGPGDETFAANVVNVESVFAFHDPMDGFETDSVDFTYSVHGWYARPEQDPLFGDPEDPWTTREAWQTLMNELGWSVGGEDDLDRALDDAHRWFERHDPTYPWSTPREKLPAQTVSSGMVYRVEWRGKNAAAQSCVPGREQPADCCEPHTKAKVAVGNTAIDALAALVAEEVGGDEGAELAELLEAFQYDLLEKLESRDGLEALDLAIFDAWFGSQSSGRLWEVAEVDRRLPDLDAEQRRLLHELNTAEATLARDERRLASLESELYGYWWKIGSFKNAIDPPAGVTLQELEGLRDALEPRVDTLRGTTIPETRAEAERLRTELEASLEPSQSLERGPATRFDLPADPVVLIHGARRSYKHGEDDRFDDDERTFVRFTGQTVDAIEVWADVPAKEPRTVLGAAELGWSVTLPNPQLLPKEVPDLLIESFFLDTATAGHIAAVGTSALGQPVSAETVARQQTVIWNPDLHPGLDRRSVTELSGLRGTIPSKLSVDLWLSPWSPLYMEWEAVWHPSSRTPREALAKWSFDGLEYRWNSGPPDVSTSVSYLGSAVLTPKSADDLGYRLAQFIGDYEDGRLGRSDLLDRLVPVLKNLLDNVIHWDLLSQSLDGLNDLLANLNPTLHLKPQGPIAEAIGNGTRTTPHPVAPRGGTRAARAAAAEAGRGERFDNRLEYIEVESPPPAIAGEAGEADAWSPFFPIRAGHFELRQLWVIDDFGQIFPVITKEEASKPIRGRGMVTEGNAKLVQLPPRLVQPARLSFAMVSAVDDGRDTADDPDANPVCGWLLHNFLDRSIAVYSPTGDALGALSLVGNPDTRRVRWDPAPETPAPVGAPPAIGNAHMQRFVETLLRRPDAPKAFVDLLEIIDSLCWTTDTPDSDVEQNLSVLVGRPLAMVRGRLENTLFGQPLFDQAWAATGKHETLGFDDVGFEIQLGSLKLARDGLLGYFVGDDYDELRTVHPLPAPRSSYISHRNLRLDFGGHNRAHVSMLLDPLGNVHAANGIMPVKVIELPAGYVDEPLAKMEVTFRTGPLLADPETIRMPTPADIRGRWSWIQRDGVTLWQDPAEIADVGQEARLDSAPPRMVDGWLKLSNAFRDDEGEEG